MRNYENGSRTADKFVVRLPDRLREEVDAAATAADSSMNTIFVRAVRQYLTGQARQELLLDALEKAVSTSRDFNIDEHARMAMDARRYRWVRDVACGTPRQDLALRDRDQQILIEGDLDAEIDRAMAAYPDDCHDGYPSAGSSTLRRATEAIQ